MLRLYHDNIIDMLEEADNRLVCHIIHLIKTGPNTVVVRTVDSDVIVILVGFMTQFLKQNPKTNIFVEFSSRSHHAFYSINEAYLKVGKCVADAVIMFHAFSGSDSTSSFYRQSKNVMFRACMSFEQVEDLTAAFTNLRCCLELLEIHMSLID